MNVLSRVPFGLLIVGVLVGGYAVVEGRTQGMSVNQCLAQFHPLAEDVVNLSVDRMIIPSGTYIDLYQVPNGNKWFILTDIAIIQTSTPDQEFELVERHNDGTITLKMTRDVMGALDNEGGNGFQSFQPRVGIAFRPGYHVAIVNKHSGSQTFDCLMSGFLSP